MPTTSNAAIRELANELGEFKEFAVHHIRQPYPPRPLRIG